MLCLRKLRKASGNEKSSLLAELAMQIRFATMFRVKYTSADLQCVWQINGPSMLWQGDSLVPGEHLHASIQSSLKHNMRAVEQHTQATELSSGRSVEIATQQIQNATKSCISGKYSGQLIKKLGMVSYTGKPLQNPWKSCLWYRQGEAKLK